MPETDDWGGVAVAPAEPPKDDWGGIAVAQNAPAEKDDWGGVPVISADDIKGIANAQVDRALGPGSLAWAANLDLSKGDATPGAKALDVFDPSKPMTADQLEAIDAAREGATYNPNATVSAAAKGMLAHPLETVSGAKDVIDLARAQMHTNEPLFKLPKPENTGVGSGVLRGVENVVEGLLTPENIALGAGISAAPKLIQQIAGGGFAAMMGKHAIEKLSDVPNLPTTGAKAEAITEALAEGGLGFLGARHAFGREGALPEGATRPAGLSPEQADRVSTQIQLRNLAPEIAPGPKDAQTITPDVLDGLNMAREKLTARLRSAPEAEKAKWQEQIDHIDDQLLRAPKDDVQASEARVAQRGQSPAPAEEPALPVATGGPPAEGGTSGLFKQAQEEEGGTTQAPNLPPVPPDHVRFYHGGIPGKGGRDVTPYYDYAKGYADKTPGAVVQYIDVPKGHPSLTKSFDDTGLGYEAPYSNFHAPDELMAGAKGVPKIEKSPEPITDPALHQAAEDSAQRIADQVTKGQGDVVRDAAYNAAIDKARAAMAKGVPPSTDLMRRAAKEAAGKTVEKTPVSLEAENEAGQTVGERQASTEATPVQQAAKADMIDAVGKQVAALPEDIRGTAQAFLDAAQNGESTSLRDLGEKLGVSQQTVANHLRKMREHFAGLKEEGYSVGPGAASITEQLNESLHSIKNASTEAGRTAAGLPERDAVGRRTFGEIWDHALQAFDENPEVGKTLVDELKGQSRPLTDREDAILTHELVDRTQEYEEALHDVSEARTEGEHAAAKDRLDKARTALHEVYDVSEKAGTENARGLSARRMMVRSDYTMIGVERKLRDILNRPISDVERERLQKPVDAVEKADEKAKAAEEEYQKAQEDAETQHFVEATINELGRAYLESPTYGKAVLDKAREIVERWKSEAEGAAERIKRALGGESGGTGGVGGGPGGRKLGEANARTALIEDIAKVIRAKVGEFGLSKAEALADLISEYGPKIQQHFDKAWTKSKQIIAAEKVPEKAKEVATKGQRKKGEPTPVEAGAAVKAEKVAGDKLSQKAIVDYVRSLINDGEHDTDALMRKTTEKMKEYFPETTERDVRRAFVDYGHKIYPSQEAVEAEIRENKQIVKITEDINREIERAQGVIDPATGELIGAEKQGYQRDKASQRVRDLIKQRNELLKKRQGPETPEKLASVQAKRRTALENAIADTDRELRTGEKRNKPADVPDDVYNEQLRAELKAMRDKVKEIDAESQPQKTTDEIAHEEAQKGVDAASAALDRWDRILKGEIEPEGPKIRESKSQLEEDMRAEVDAMKKAAAEIRRNSTKGDPHFEEEQRQLAAIEKSIAEYERRANQLDFSSRGKKLGPDTENIAKAKAAKAAAKKVYDDLKKAQKPPRDPAQKQIEQLSKIRDRLDETLSGKRPENAPKDWTPLSGEAENLKAEIQAMHELKAQMKREAKPAGDPNAEKEKQQIKAFEKAIEKLEERLKNNDFTPDGRWQGPLTEKAAAVKAVLDARREAYNAAKNAGKPVKSADERYNETRLKQIQKRTKELEALKTSGRATTSKMGPQAAPKVKFAEVAKAEADLAAKKREVDNELRRIAYENRTTPQQVKEAATNVLKMITAVKVLGHGTVGMFTHAGGLAWRPTVAKTFWTNFGRQFKLWTNRAYHEQAVYRLTHDPEFQTWKDAGASIDPEKTYTDYGLYAKWLGKLGEGGTRGFDALKLTRLELNKADWGKVPDSIKADPEQAGAMRQMIAEINNKATGAIPKTSPVVKEGEPGRTEKALYGLAKNPLADAVFFAPKLYASRWARVLFDPVKTASTLADWKNASLAERQAALVRLKNAGWFVGTYMGALLINQGLLSVSGSDQKVNITDPTKSDWLKFKAGGKEIVADGGLLDPVRLLGRIVIGDLINARTRNQEYREGTRFQKVTDDLARYARSKFNPTLGLITDAATGTDFAGKPLPFSKEPPKYKDQGKYTWPEWLMQQGPIPLSQGTRMAYDEMRKKGMSHLQIMDFLKGAATAVIGGTGVHVTEEPTHQGAQPASAGSRHPQKRR